MNPEAASLSRWVYARMKVKGIYDCENDYDADQAKDEDVPDIVVRYASAGALFSLVAAGPPIGTFQALIGWASTSLSARSYRTVP
jgi:hypothetical protein